MTEKAGSAEAFGAPTFIVRQDGGPDAAVNKKYFGPALAGKKWMSERLWI